MKGHTCTHAVAELFVSSAMWNQLCCTVPTLGDVACGCFATAATYTSLSPPPIPTRGLAGTPRVQCTMEELSMCIIGCFAGQATDIGPCRDRVLAIDHPQLTLGYAQWL